MIDRREFLRALAAAGGVAAAGRWGGLTGLAVAREGGSILDLPAAESPITHVVVLMMENRSVDHYLGWLATDAAYLDAARSRYGGDFAFDGDQDQAFPDPDGVVHCTYHLPSKAGEASPYRGCHHPDPGHGWDHGRAQRDGGFLAEGSRNDPFAIGYYRDADIPVYAALARRFTTFDRYHCSLLAPTFPNREYLHSAQSGGVKNNALPIATLGYQWETIWDRFRVAGVPARYYFVDLPTIALWGPRLMPYASHIERYFADAAAGQLPNVTFVDPGFTTGFRTDDHPFADIRSGQKYVADVLKAFVDSPHWEHGAFLLTYDEWGGFFDHVPPPRLPDERASSDDDNDFGQAGFRVPTFLASPYARPGFVDHEPYDHTSILRFLEWRFLGAPATGPGRAGDRWFLTQRDRHANNIGLSLRAEAPDPELGFPLELAVPVTSTPCPGEELEGTGAPRPPVHAPDGFDVMLASGYLERVGYRPGPGLPAELRPRVEAAAPAAGGSAACATAAPAGAPAGEPVDVQGRRSQAPAEPDDVLPASGGTGAVVAGLAATAAGLAAAAAARRAEAPPP